VAERHQTSFHAGQEGQQVSAAWKVQWWSLYAVLSDQYQCSTAVGYTYHHNRLPTVHVAAVQYTAHCNNVHLSLSLSLSVLTAIFQVNLG